MTHFAPMTPKQLKLRLCKLSGSGVVSQARGRSDAIMAKIIEAPL